MLGYMREKFGPVVVGGIIGFIAFVFIFFGIFTPDSSITGAVAGSVNGEPIHLRDFNREMNRRLEFFRNMNLNEEQLKAFRIRESVFRELVNRKLVVQDATKRGVLPSNEEVRTAIREIDAFKVEGKFDALQYKQVLESNQYTLSGFEQSVREDLTVRSWHRQFQDLVKVTKAETEREFMAERDRRTLKMVALTPDRIAQGVLVPGTEIDSWLAVEGNKNLIKTRYEGQKTTVFKGKTLAQVERDLAREMIAAEKTDEIRRLTEELSAKVKGMLSASDKDDAAVNALLKPYGIEVRKTPAISRANSFVPGAGEVRELVTEAFAEPSPINAAAGGKPKVYSTPNGAIVALVVASEKADLAKLDLAERSKIVLRVANRKETALADAMMKKLNERAKVKASKEIVGSDEEG